MTAKEQPTNWWYSFNKWLGGLPPMTWFMSHTMHHLDPLTYRLTGGRYTAISLLAGLPVILITTTGARSGESRTIPLNGFMKGDNLALIASNWGRSTAPGWYYNLRANPTATVTVDNQSTPYIAHEASDEEYASYWQQAVDTYPGYAAYKQRAGRHIPIMVLTPDRGPKESA